VFLKREAGIMRSIGFSFFMVLVCIVFLTAEEKSLLLSQP